MENEYLPLFLFPLGENYVINPLCCIFLDPAQLCGEHGDRRGHQEVLLQSWNKEHPGTTGFLLQASLHPAAAPLNQEEAAGTHYSLDLVSQRVLSSFQSVLTEVLAAAIK